MADGGSIVRFVKRSTLTRRTRWKPEDLSISLFTKYVIKRADKKFIQNLLNSA